MFDHLLGLNSAVLGPGRRGIAGRLALAGAIALTQVAPAFATIDNTATSKGATTPAGALNPYGSSTDNVPVQGASPALSVAKTAAAPTTHTVNGVNGTYAGDTITFTYVVTNSGNVTINSAQPVDSGPKFNSIAGSATLAAFTLSTTTGGGAAGTSNASGATANLPPGATATFTAVYTLSSQDVYEAVQLASNNVSNSATATGAPTRGTLGTVTASSTTATIAPVYNLCINKTYAMPHAQAQLGDVVTYSYAVTNCGTATMYNVQVVDQHGSPAVQINPGSGAGFISGETLTTPSGTGAVTSADTTANNGIWSTLGAGAVVTFTWSHAVTQAELDHG